MLDTVKKYNLELPAGLVEYTYKLKNDNPKIDLRSNVNGWQSSQYTIDKQNTQVVEFLSKCLKILNLENYTIRQYWFNINPHGAYHNWHNHGGTDYVAVYYLQVPKNSGNIELKNNSVIENIEPYAGMLLLFPAGIDHRVLPNLSNLDRITLAFNLKSKG